MLYWDKYNGHDCKIEGSRKLYDNNIYTFDIETTSYFILNNNIYPAIHYDNLSKKEQEASIKCCNMYLWQFGINDIVYYGRTWQELKLFLDKLDLYIPYQKYVFVHNLSFEFQFLKSVFHFNKVMARTSHKVINAELRDYNIIFKCSYYMSNCSLENLSKLYKLNVEKQVGSLDYDKLRHSKTVLTDLELKYAEYDCLVVYEYIKFELKEYETVKNIPNTSTGHVRRELQELVKKDYKYKARVRKSINTDPHIYNLLVEAFAGGYTHANFIYTDEILNNVDSYDETSAYPFVMVTYKFPSTEFKKCNIKRVEQMSKKLAYILVVKLKNVKCKYLNTFISASKCRKIKGLKLDNGRIIEASELEITITDIDFYFYLDSYTFEYEILESYFSVYNYLPKEFINFILDKYVIKTTYKGIEEKELEYAKEKNKFNALYGMSVTNTIRDEVLYLDEIENWVERELTNDEIVDRLIVEKKKAFLSFSYGVWVTAYARNNLLRRVIDLDEFVIYCDTDSMKLIKGYDKSVIENYNNQVLNKLEYTANKLNIDINRFSPVDIKNIKRPLGVFTFEYKYQEFITQGAKKYAYKLNDKINITVAGVPKKASKSLKDLSNFKDNYVFKHEDTGKNILMYVDDMQPIVMEDYQGNKLLLTDKSGCSLIPTTYVLSKALDYTNLLTDNSSKRAIYKEVRI